MGGGEDRSARKWSRSPTERKSNKEHDGEDRPARKRSRSPTERKSNKERDETKGERQSRSDRNTEKGTVHQIVSQISYSQFTKNFCDFFFNCQAEKN